MRLSSPIYRKLPACKDLSNDEVEELTRETFRRQPRLAYYPVLATVVLFPIATLTPRLLENWWAIEKPWSLVAAALVFGIPMILFEAFVHSPAVNREFERVMAERSLSRNRTETV